MHGPIAHIAAFAGRIARLARGHIAPAGAMGQDATAGGAGRGAGAGDEAWHRPIGEHIARRATRVCNRDRDLAAAYERKHTILSRGRQ